MMLMPAFDELAIDTLPNHITALLWSYRLPSGGTVPLAIVAASVMDRGDLGSMRWLMQHVGATRLRLILPTIARRLSPRSLALWRCLLGGPHPSTGGIPWVAG